MKTKLLSINLWNGGILFKELLQFIRQENPDILAVQEAYNGETDALEDRFCSFGKLAKQLNFGYSSFAPAFYEIHSGIKVDSGNAVFSRFPIVSSTTIFYDVPYGEREIGQKEFSRTPRNLQNVILDLEGTSLNIFNTQGVWGIDGEDSPRRLAMSRVIIENIRNKRNVILSGDFNVRDHTESIRNIEAHMVNVFKAKLKTSFNLKRKENNPGFADACVDMIFVSPEMNVLEAYCPDVDISDHLPQGIVFDLGSSQ